MNHNVFALMVLLSSCSFYSKNEEEIAKQFPSDKIIYPKDLNYEERNGYCFVKKKDNKYFNLACKISVNGEVDCVDVWGEMSKDEFLSFMSIWSEYYKKYEAGERLALVSKTEDSLYFCRTEIKGFFYKEMVIKKTGPKKFSLINEKVYTDAKENGE